MTDLLALAERCEREKPSPDLDEAIWLTLYPKDQPTNWLDYTSSIDDAVTLVPDGCRWSVDTEPPQDSMGAVFVAREARGPKIICGQMTSKTPALAICAAALRARVFISSRQAA